MKKLLITLLLISPFSFANSLPNWGDVYYCQMSSFVETDEDGTVKQFKLERFQFKLDNSEQAMVFGNSGYLKGTKLKLADWAKDLPENRWDASWQFSIAKFREGKFLVASVYPDLIVSITADCEKF